MPSSKARVVWILWDGNNGGEVFRTRAEALEALADSEEFEAGDGPYEVGRYVLDDDEQGDPSDE